MSNRSKIHYAVVGTGWFGQAAVLPGFANATNAKLEAVVSGDPVKRKELSEKYGVSAHSYEEYDALLASGRIDAVYIVLPNSMHRDFTVRAAKHKVHVLCEKPLAATAAECREMIDTCRREGVRLMTAYRLHLESANLAAIDLLESGKIGELRAYHGFLTQEVDAGNTRLEGDTAGHPLTDVGIYCLNASRYLFQDDPVEVSAFVAQGSDPKFSEVPEMVSAVLRFPKDRLATFTCGFGEASVSEYRVIGTKGDLRLEDAFTFQDGATMHVTVGKETETTKFDFHDQVGAEIDYFAECIIEGHDPEPDGNEGLIDMTIVEAILESAKTGRSVKLQAFPKKARPEPDQEYKFSPVKKPNLVHAAPPSGE